VMSEVEQVMPIGLTRGSIQRSGQTLYFVDGLDSGQTSPPLEES
jgi:hypothetical protein